MSRHPNYYIVYEARMKEIQKSFDKFCSKEYSLEKIVKQAPNQPDGYMDWPLFIIKDQNGISLATFHSTGEFELIDNTFKKKFDKMVQAIEKVAEEKMKEVEIKEKKDWAEIHGFDPTLQKIEKEKKKD